MHLLINNIERFDTGSFMGVWRVHKTFHKAKQSRHRLVHCTRTAVVEHPLLSHEETQEHINIWEHCSPLELSDVELIEPVQVFVENRDPVAHEDVEMTLFSAQRDDPEIPDHSVTRPMSQFNKMDNKFMRLYAHETNMKNNSLISSMQFSDELLAYPTDQLMKMKCSDRLKYAVTLRKKVWAGMTSEARAVDHNCVKWICKETPRCETLVTPQEYKPWTRESSPPKWHVSGKMGNIQYVVKGWCNERWT